MASYRSGSPYALNFRSLSWSASLASRSVAPVAAISPSAVFAIAVQVPSEASSKVIHVSPLSFALPLFLLTSVIWTAYGDHPASVLEYPDPAEGLHGNGVVGNQRTSVLGRRPRPLDGALCAGRRITGRMSSTPISRRIIAEKGFLPSARTRYDVPPELTALATPSRSVPLQALVPRDRDQVSGAEMGRHLH